MSAQLACYGFITCFDGNSDTCQSCDAAKQCQKTCYDKLRKMDGGIGEVVRLTRKHERWANRFGNKVKTNTAPVRENFQVPDDHQRVSGLSRTANIIARAALHNFVDFNRPERIDLNGLNPQYLRIMLRQYQQGQVNTRQVIETLKSDLHWAEGTAKSYAAGYIELLVHWKLVKRVKRGQYEVNA